MIESEDMTNMYLSIYSFIKRFMANRYIGHFMDKPTRYWVFYMLVAALDLNVSLMMINDDHAPLQVFQPV